MRDVLTAIRALKEHPRVTTVHLAGTGAGGVWALLARAAAGDAVGKTVVDVGGFGFSSVTTPTHADLLPGLSSTADWGLRHRGWAGPLDVLGASGAAANELKVAADVARAAGCRSEWKRERPTRRKSPRAWPNREVPRAGGSTRDWRRSLAWNANGFFRRAVIPMSETVVPMICACSLPLLAELSTAQKVSDTILFPLVGCLLLMGVLAILGRVPPSYNLKNLMSRWKTSIMTALAFTLVVALMTVMLAFVNGMVKLTEQSGRPGNVLVLSDGATDESFSNLGFVDTGDIARVEGVLRDKETGEPLASRETFLIVTQPLDPTPGKGFEIKEGEGVPKARRRFLQVRGIEDP